MSITENAIRLMNIDPENSLIFLDGEGLGKYIALKDRERGILTICVEAADKREKINHQYYKINQKIKRIMSIYSRQFNESGLQFSKVLHLWTYQKLSDLPDDLVKARSEVKLKEWSV